MSVKAFRQTPAELIQAATELSGQLQNWRKSLSPLYEPRTPVKSGRFPPNITPLHVIYLHYAYYGSLMAIHTIFAYPWISAIFEHDESLAFRNQVALSSNTIADAARNIVLTARCVEIDAATPQWYGSSQDMKYRLDIYAEFDPRSAFYYPMVGLINLFISLLKNPTLPSAQSDVALLDMVAGHFAHMEFVTSSELAFPFTREVAALARSTVKKAKEESTSAIVPTNLENGQFDLDPTSLVTVRSYLFVYLRVICRLSNLLTLALAGHFQYG